MRHLIDAMILLESSEGTFRLAPGLDPGNYHMTESLAEWRQWRAMTYDANNNGTVGELEPILYVWISTKDNTIIPISRGDEHNRGGDTVRGLIMSRHLSIRPSDYIPVSIPGPNYVYPNHDMKAWVTVFKKFLAYGGANTAVEGASSLGGKIMTIRHFIEHDGFIESVPGKLAPMGQDFVDAHKKLAEIFLASLRSGKPAPAFQAALKMLNYYGSLHYFWMRDIVDDAKIKAMRQEVMELRKDGDVNGLERMFFSFGSPKQKMHVDLKQVQARIASGKKNPEDNSVRGFWGDINLAVDMLSDI